MQELTSHQGSLIAGREILDQERWHRRGFQETWSHSLDLRLSHQVSGPAVTNFWICTASSLEKEIAEVRPDLLPSALMFDQSRWRRTCCHTVDFEREARTNCEPVVFGMTGSPWRKLPSSTMILSSNGLRVVKRS